MAENKKIELLSPAGSYETFRAVVSAGADAVYLGMQKFGARAYAENFTEEQVLAALDEAHLFDKKIYLTVNTLFKENELCELYKLIRPLYERGLDAVIVQDAGVLRFIKKYFPDLPIHASTQMTVTGYEGAKLLENLGVTRVIPARELTIEEIKKIRQETSLEIECFVHGALCYCYSGMCLMSSFIGGRSGNRGRCAQPCRLPYDLYNDGKVLTNKNNKFVLNTKDICLIDFIPQLAGAGIDSFKIEGRMKRAEYAAGVVSVYRKYIDQYENGCFSNVSKADKQLLFDLFNRDGFSSGYFFKSPDGSMLAPKNERISGKRKERAETAYKTVNENVIDRPLKKPLKAEFKINNKLLGRFTVSDGKESEGMVFDDAQEAKSRPLSRRDIVKQLAKTGGTAFEFESIDVDIPDNIFMTAGRLNEIRRRALEYFAEKKLASGYKNRRPAVEFSKNKEVYNRPANHKVRRLGVLVSESEQLDAVSALDCVDTIYIPYQLYLRAGDDIKNDSRAVIALPFISRYEAGGEYKKELMELAGKNKRFLVRSLEDAAALTSAGYADNIRLDYCLYTMNSESLAFWTGLGVKYNTAPLELNRHELTRRDNANSEIIIYGRIPLMISAQNVVRNLSGEAGKDAYLIDRKNARFPVKTQNGYDLIYNSVPVCLMAETEGLANMGFSEYRICLASENPKQTKRLISGIYAAIKFDEPFNEDFAFTRGHFNRGVD